MGRLIYGYVKGAAFFYAFLRFRSHRTGKAGGPAHLPANLRTPGAGPCVRQRLLWCWFSRGIGGYSALDYLIKVNGYSFLEAMETISGRTAIPPPSFVPAPKEEKPKHLLLPQAAPDNRAMMAYLKGRGIDQEILDYCVQTGRIYESRNKGHSNVVFVGFDKDGKARFGCLRGIREARFHGDLSGSDKQFSFALPACVENLAVHL